MRLPVEDQICEDFYERQDKVTNMARKNRISPKALFLGSIIMLLTFFPSSVPAQTFDFDEGLEVLTKGLILVKKEAMKDKKIAVFGIVESKSGKKWAISSHIEDGIVDVLVNQGYTIIERRRIEDIIKKELKKKADLWFDEAQVAEFGKLVGADVVVTGNYVKWGRAMLRIGIRAINVSNGKVLAANKVKIHTDRIADLLNPVKDENTAQIKEKTEVKTKPPEAPTPGSRAKLPGPSTPQMGSFCCDQFGNRRCGLVQPFPLGSSCFCFGQGYGYTCQ